MILSTKGAQSKRFKTLDKILFFSLRILFFAPLLKVARKLPLPAIQKYPDFNQKGENFIIFFHCYT